MPHKRGFAQPTLSTVLHHCEMASDYGARMAGDNPTITIDELLLRANPYFRPVELEAKEYLNPATWIRAVAEGFHRVRQSSSS